MDPASAAFKVVVFAPPIMAAVILHEVAHGWVAEKFGDTTARRAGRITLNPISHIDPIGTVLLPLILVAMGSRILFGWAKPVPVNFAALRNPKRDMIWVALSGPTTNLVLGLASAMLMGVVLSIEPAVWRIAQSDLAPGMLGNLGLRVSVLVALMMMLNASIIINGILMVLNLMPVPPLDGSRVVSGLLPDDLARSYAKIEPYGVLIVLFLLFFVPPAQKVLSVFVFFFVEIFYRVALLWV